MIASLSSYLFEDETTSTALSCTKSDVDRCVFVAALRDDVTAFDTQQALMKVLRRVCDDRPDTFHLVMASERATRCEQCLKDSAQFKFAAFWLCERCFNERTRMSQHTDDVQQVSLPFYASASEPHLVETQLRKHNLERYFDTLQRHQLCFFLPLSQLTRDRLLDIGVGVDDLAAFGVLIETLRARVRRARRLLRRNDRLRERQRQLLASDDDSDASDSTDSDAATPTTRLRFDRRVRVRAVRDVVAQPTNDEPRPQLSLTKGDIVVVMSHDELDDFWLGERARDGVVGWFDARAVKLAPRAQQRSATTPPAPATRAPDAPPDKFAAPPVRSAFHVAERDGDRTISGMVFVDENGQNTLRVQWHDEQTKRRGWWTNVCDALAMQLTQDHFLRRVQSS